MSGCQKRQSGAQAMISCSWLYVAIAVFALGGQVFADRYARRRVAEALGM